MTFERQRKAESPHIEKLKGIVTQTDMRKICLLTEERTYLRVKSIAALRDDRIQDIVQRAFDNYIKESNIYE